MRRSKLAESVRCVLLLGVFAHGAAHAQSAAQPAAQQAPSTPASPSDQAVTLDAVQVTGIRGSLAKSVADKRAADQVSDVIVAEDIGKFPTQNLADSLQRITGVQIARSRGEGASAAVRGLPADFTQVIYNGRPIAGTGRSFDFSILSSSFVGSLSAYKTPVAEMREGGLSATINVETIKPLSLKQRTATVTAEAIHESNAGKTTPHLSGLYADQYLDGRLGVAVGFDWSRRELEDRSVFSYGQEQRSERSTDAAGRPVLNDVNRDGDYDDSYRFAHGVGRSLDIGRRDRASAMANVQFRATDALELRGDLLYSKLKTDSFGVGDILRFTNQIGANQYADWTLDRANENTLSYLDANGVDHRNNGRGGLSESTLTSFAAGANWVNDRWTVDGEIGASRVKSESTSLSLEVIGRASASYDFGDNHGAPPKVTYNRGYDPLNPANFRATSLNGGYKTPNEGKVDDARLDFAYDLDGWVDKLKFGVTWDRRQYDYDSRSIYVGAQQLAQMLGVPYDPARENGGSFDGSRWMRDYGGFLTSDIDALLRDLPLSQILAKYPAERQLAGVAQLREDNSAAYVRADFEGLDGRLSGNLGLRYVRTRQRSAGYAPNLDDVIFREGGAVTILPDVTLQKIERKYNELLPSLNARYDFNEQWVARLGLARVLSRPDIDRLMPRTNINVNVRTISSGNPKLDPYLADQIDLSLEWYFNPESLLSMTAFYKDVKNLVVEGSTRETRTVKLEGGGTRVVEFTRFLPENGANGKVKGIELSYQQPLSFLPGAWDGLGVMANYTWLDVSDVRTVENGPLQPVNNVSKNSYNAILYYEKPRFGLYAAYNYRSGYRNGAGFFQDGNFAKAYGQLDLSANVKLSDAVTLNATVANLSNEKVSTYNRFGYFLGDSESGRRITLGLRYDFK